MFVSRRKYIAALQEIAESHAFISEQTFEIESLRNEVEHYYTEYAFASESNDHWREIYVAQRTEINELYTEVEELRFANYELMGYEADTDVLF